MTVFVKSWFAEPFRFHGDLHENQVVNVAMVFTIKPINIKSGYGGQPDVPGIRFYTNSLYSDGSIITKTWAYQNVEDRDIELERLSDNNFGKWGAT